MQLFQMLAENKNFGTTPLSEVQWLLYSLAHMSPFFNKPNSWSNKRAMSFHSALIGVSSMGLICDHKQSTYLLGRSYWCLSTKSIGIAVLCSAFSTPIRAKPRAASLPKAMPVLDC